MNKNHIGWAAAAALLIPAASGAIPTEVRPDLSEKTIIDRFMENVVMTPSELLKGGSYAILKGLTAKNDTGTIFVCSRENEPGGEYGSQQRPGQFIAVHKSLASGELRYIFDIDADHNQGSPYQVSAIVGPTTIKAYEWSTGKDVFLRKSEVDDLRKIASTMLSSCDNLRQSYRDQERVMSLRARSPLTNVSADTDSIWPANYAWGMYLTQPQKPEPTSQGLQLRGYQK